MEWAFPGRKKVVCDRIKGGDELSVRIVKKGVVVDFWRKGESSVRWYRMDIPTESVNLAKFAQMFGDLTIDILGEEQGGPGTLSFYSIREWKKEVRLRFEEN